MKNTSLFSVCLFAAALALTSCNGDTESHSSATTDTSKVVADIAPPAISAQQVSYSDGKINMVGYVAYDSSVRKKRPVVLVVHEWWGISDYTKRRADQLAKLGYLAMAIDMYGEGKTADNPGDAGKLAGPFYADPQMAKGRFDAALAKIKTFDVADTSQVAAIGYCFGGAQVINAAKLGDKLAGVVSFHGNLAGAPAVKGLLTTPILVCHGEDDKFVLPAEVAAFKKSMDSIGASYTFKSYPGATHAFTNPEATAKGEKFKIPIAYNAAADTASWQDMKDFFSRIFK